MCRVEQRKRFRIERRKAEIYGEWADCGDGALPAVSAGSPKWVEAAAIIFSLGHDGIVGPMQHDSPVSGVLWTGNTVVVAGGANLSVPPLLLASISRYCAVLGGCCGIIRM